MVKLSSVPATLKTLLNFLVPANARVNASHAIVIVTTICIITMVVIVFGAIRTCSGISFDMENRQQSWYEVVLKCNCYGTAQVYKQHPE